MDVEETNGKYVHPKQKNKIIIKYERIYGFYTKKHATSRTTKSLNLLYRMYFIYIFVLSNLNRLQGRHV